MRAGYVFALARRAAMCSSAVLALGTSLALAQTSPAPAPSPAVPAPKATPRPVPPQQKQAQPPAKQPQAPVAQPGVPTAPGTPGAPGADQQQAQGEQPPVVFSPWTKFCGKDNNNPQAKEVCLTMKEARLETGQFLAGAALIEQAGDEKKVIRITVPLTMQLPPGARIVLDKEQPVTGQYILCVPNGCMADFQIPADFVGKLKKGQQMVLQSINMSGQTASFALPLADFAKANEGPATDPKKAEEDRQKMQDEMQRKAEEARKKLQATPGGTPPAKK
jgi:invasion protein IalB